MPRVVRELKDMESLAPIPGRLRAWGYPRELLDWEIEGSIWITFGPDVVAWFNHDEWLAERGGLGVHLAVDPESHSRVYGRELLTALRVVAGLCEARELWARTPLPPDVADYCKRLRWIETEQGWYTPLGRA